MSRMLHLNDPDLIAAGLVNVGGKWLARGAAAERGLSPALTTKAPPEPNDGYDSNLEREFARSLEAERVAGLLFHWEREPLTIRLPGGIRYKPDFLVLRSDGLTFYETKPNFTQKEARVGEVKLKLAAEWCRKWGIHLYRTTRVDGAWMHEELS